MDVCIVPMGGVSFQVYFASGQFSYFIYCLEYSTQPTNLPLIIGVVVGGSVLLLIIVGLIVAIAVLKKRKSIVARTSLPSGLNFVSPNGIQSYADGYYTKRDRIAPTIGSALTARGLQWHPTYAFDARSINLLDDEDGLPSGLKPPTVQQQRFKCRDLKKAVVKRPWKKNDNAESIPSSTMTRRSENNYDVRWPSTIDVDYPESPPRSYATRFTNNSNRGGNLAHLYGPAELAPSSSFSQQQQGNQAPKGSPYRRGGRDGLGTIRSAMNREDLMRQVPYDPGAHDYSRVVDRNVDSFHDPPSTGHEAGSTPERNRNAKHLPRILITADNADDDDGEAEMLGSDERSSVRQPVRRQNTYTDDCSSIGISQRNGYITLRI